MKKAIFLDMDGVLVDWDVGVRERFGVEWYPTEWDIPYEEVFNMTSKDFWNHLDDPNFWAELPWTRDGRAIYGLVKTFKPCILTVARCVGARVGKPWWLKKNLPKIFYGGRYFIAGGAKKHYLAHPAAILIDDCDAYAEAWEAAGGKVILYPRPWNKNRDIVDGLQYLHKMLAEYL